MSYIVVSKWTNGNFWECVFNGNEKQKAINEFKELKNRKDCFTGKPFFSSVQLFELVSDPQEVGNYPIYNPIKKYINGKWVKTKFYKKIYGGNI